MKLCNKATDENQCNEERRENVFQVGYGKSYMALDREEVEKPPKYWGGTKSWNQGDVLVPYKRSIHALFLCVFEESTGLH